MRERRAERGALGPWVVGAAAVVGLALRIWIARSPAGTLSSDEAVVGLMARHLLDGEWRAFFWGQHYGGTLEVGLVAVATWVTGSGLLALKLVPCVGSLAAAVLVWRLGRRLVGDRPAVVAGLLFWLGPTAYLWLAGRELGFYWVSLALDLLLLLVALRLVEGGDRRAWATFGLLAGLAWWTSPFSAYALLPAGLWLLHHRRRLPAGRWWSVPAAALGALPWLWHNVGGGWPSLEAPPQPEQVGVLTGAGRLVWRTLPMIAGLREVRTERWLFPGAAVVFVVGALTLVAVAVARRSRVPRFLLLCLATSALVHVALPGRWWVGDGRYGLFLWPFLALALAWAARGRAAEAALLVAVPVLALAGGGDIGASRPPVHLGADIRQLEAAGIDRGRADYWLAYRLTFESGERIVVVPTSSDRYDPYRRAVAPAPRPAVIVLAEDPQVAELRRAVPARREVRTEHLVAFTEP